jgi:hypothetical protein
MLFGIFKNGLASYYCDTVYVNINEIDYKKSESIKAHNNGKRNTPTYGFAMNCDNCPVKEISFYGYVDIVQKEFAPIRVIGKKEFKHLKFLPAKETIDGITSGTKYLKDKIFFVEKFGKQYKVYQVKFFQP